MSFVLDSSVSLAWCFHDEQTHEIMDLLDVATAQGAVAPLLWPLEALNGLHTAQRRRRIDADQRDKFAAFLQDLPIMLDPETTARTWTSTARLADRFRLTIYDAAYLELAHRRGLPLASLDGDLRNAAASLGVVTLGKAV